MEIKHVAFIMYPVADMPRAVAFYRDALGLQSGELTADFWNEFEIAGTTFGIGNFAQVGTPGSAQSLSLEVPDIHAAQADLRAKNVDASDPHDLGNCWVVAVKDPDGNTVWLHQRKTS